MAMDFGKLNFAVGFNRTSAFPLDANSYFEDYDAAVLAANGAAEVGSADSAYYIGQLIIVKDTAKGVGLYQISASKTLVKFGQASSADELTTDLNNLIGRFNNLVRDLPVTEEEDGSFTLQAPSVEIPLGFFSNDEKEKLAGIDAGAQVNKIEAIQLDDKDIAITDKKVNIKLANTYLKADVAQTTYVKKEEGKGLSTNDYDATAKAIVDGVTDNLAKKVDKEEGKGLSTNDYDNAAVAEVAKIKDKADASTVTALGGRVTTLEGKIAGVTGAMHFKGVLAELPAELTSYEPGDVVIVDKKEYVCAEESGVKSWHELGDEGSHLTKDEAASKYQTIDDYNTGYGALDERIKANTAAIAAEKERAEGEEARIENKVDGNTTSISGLATRVKAVEDDYLKAADKTELENAIGEKADKTALDDAVEAATALTGRVANIEKDYLKAADKAELTTAIGEKADKTALTAATNRVAALETSVGKAAAGEEAATGLYKSLADEVAARIKVETKANTLESNYNTLTSRVGTADDVADENGSLFARMSQLKADLESGLEAAGKIDSITINGEAVAIEGKVAKIELPAAFISGLKAGEESLKVEDGKLELVKVSTDKLVQGTTTLVLNGGDSTI